MKFSVVSAKITVRNKIFFDSHVIAAKSFTIFVSHAKLPKIVIFSTETIESNPYFQQLISVENGLLLTFPFKSHKNHCCPVVTCRSTTSQTSTSKPLLMTRAVTYAHHFRTELLDSDQGAATGSTVHLGPLGGVATSTHP
jgi:hypothetical protein